MNFKKHFVNLRVFAPSCLLLAVLTGCAGEFAEDPTRPRPTRAVQNNVERNSASGEVEGPSAGGALPFLSVEYGGKKGEPPRVRTIADPLRDTTDEPRTTTRPATQPSTQSRDPMFDK